MSDPPLQKIKQKSEPRFGIRNLGGNACLNTYFAWFRLSGVPRGNKPLTIADSLQGRPFGTLTQQPALVAMAAWPLWISRLYVPGELRIREDSERAFRFYLMMRKTSRARYEPSMIRTMEKRVQSCQTCDLIEGICVPADCGAGALPVRTDPSRLLTHINLQPVSVDMCYLCFCACCLQKQEQRNSLLYYHLMKPCIFMLGFLNVCIRCRTGCAGTAPIEIQTPRSQGILCSFCNEMKPNYWYRRKWSKWCFQGCKILKMQIKLEW